MQATQDYIARQAIVDATTARIRTLAPDGWKVVIIAEEHADDSDIYTDYHNHTVGRRVLLGFRKGTRENFRTLRKAAATFGPTDHMAPGMDLYTVRAVWIEDDPDRGDMKGHYTRGDLHGDKFTTEAQAQAAIDKADSLRSNAEYVIHHESIEHRENYSMGGGNYLKSGFRHSHGWCVMSRPLEWSLDGNIEIEHYENKVGAA